MSHGLIAVAPDKFQAGVSGPDTDWRMDPSPRGHPRPRFQVLDLHEALRRTWETDAHLVAYVLKFPDGTPFAWQPRVNKDGLEYLRHEGFKVEAQVIFLDIDNENHERWTPESEQHAIERYGSWGNERTFGIYHTAKGARFLQPLTEPVPIEHFEAQMRAFKRRIQALGVQVDEACKDWTRHFRLPHVQRDGKAYRSSFLTL